METADAACQAAEQAEAEKSARIKSRGPLIRRRWRAVATYAMEMPSLSSEWTRSVVAHARWASVYAAFSSSGTRDAAHNQRLLEETRCAHAARRALRREAENRDFGGVL